MLQAGGPRVFLRPEVASELKLSEAQKEKIQALEGQRGERNGPPSREDRDAMKAKALSILTDAQRAQWKKMTGKAFNLPEPPRPPQGGPEGI